MASAKHKKPVPIRWVSKDEFSAMVDSRARRVLGISAHQFVSRWNKGQYRKLDSDTCPGVVELAILAPLPRTKRGRKNSTRGGK
jgi:hypothetical protein